MRKWLFVERRFGFAHAIPEIHNPFACRTAGEIHAVHPGFENIRVGPSVRIRRKAQPYPSKITRYVERPALDVSLKGDPTVPRQWGYSRQIERLAGQIRVDPYAYSFR